MKETTFSKADSQEIVDAFVPPSLNEEEKHLIEKFFTNLDKSVYSIFLLPPEIAGALCSKTSRSRDDLRKIFLNEFIKPFLESEYGKSLQEFIEFLQKSDALKKIFNNPKARDFYSRWLAEYGDDSIAQMAGSYVIFSGLSQIAIKHFENQRIGLAPIEKSTRYVDFSVKINNHYPYFVPPEIKETNLYNEYQETMDYVFKTYSKLYEKYFNYLLKQVFPNEKEIVLKTKSFDVMRLILPMATLGQVAFFGNGQAFEYAINRSLNNTLEEIRWAGKRIKEELDQITPSFLRRIEKEESFQYRKYLSERKERIDNFLEKNWQKEKKLSKEEVKLLEYDPKGEDKIIAGLIYPETKEDFLSVINKVEKMPQKQKEDLLNEVLKDRKFRWQKIPRAFENVYVLWEIVSNIGAWRDIQRHRMHTQYHQRFNIYLGYDIPQELENVSLKNLKNKFVLAIKKLEELYKKLEKINPELSQYAVSFAHKIRFIQYQNLREVFWETELRTTSQGHPDYRKIEQIKAKKIMEIYPLIKKYLLVDFKSYNFARREYKNNTPENK